MEYTKQYQEMVNDIIALLEQLNTRKISLPEFRKEFQNLKDKEKGQTKKATSLFTILLYKPANDSKFISNYKALKKHITRDIPFIDNKASFFLEYESKPDFGDEEKNKKYLFRWLLKRKHFLTVFDFSSLNAIVNKWDTYERGFAILHNDDADEIIHVLRKINNFAYKDLLFVDLYFVMLYRVFKYFYNHSVSITVLDTIISDEYNDAMELINPIGSSRSSLKIFDSPQANDEIIERIRLLLYYIYKYFGKTILTAECETYQSEIPSIRRISFENYDKFVNDVHNIRFIGSEPEFLFKDVIFPKETDKLLERFETIEVK